MRRKKTSTTHKFYAVSTHQGHRWASELEPISSTTAKRCMSCGRNSGVFFRDCGPMWDPFEPVTVRTTTQTVECYGCCIDNDGPFYTVDRKGRTHQPYRSTIMLASDRNQLAELITAWVNGQKWYREVETPWGVVVAFSSLENRPKGNDYSLECPHCEKLITLSVSPD
jgi:hypothetical protein